MLPTAGISLLTMNVATSAAGATMDNIIQNYPGNSKKYTFVTIRSEIPFHIQNNKSVTCVHCFLELTVEERGMLLNIRKKKMELLHEISQLKDELTEVNTEIEAMDTEEG